MDQGHLGGKACQERGFLHRRVTTADHDDLFFAEEGAIAGCAGADAASFLRVFTFRSEPDRLCAGADDDGVGMMGFSFDRDGKGAGA